LRRFGVAVLCAKVVLIPLVFDQVADFSFVVPKALTSHALTYLLVGVMAALLVRFGREIFVWSWLHVPVLAFLGANVAATGVAVDMRLALYGTHERMLGLGTIADWVVLYFAVVLLVRTRRETIAVIASVFGAAAMVLAYEFVQFIGADPLRWTLDGASRPFSTLGNPNILAQYLTTLAIGALAIAISADDLDSRVRGGALVGSAALIIGAAATGTRSALLGIAAGSFLLVLLIWGLHPSKRARAVSLITAAGATLVLAALITLTPLGSRALTVFESATSGLDEDILSRIEPSTASRLALYRLGLEMVRERPILGYGPDNFPVGVARHRSESEPPEVQLSLASSAHSWVAYVATSSGLVGFACFLAIVVVALGVTFRSGFRPLSFAGAAMVAAWLGTGLTTVNEVDTDWLFWLGAGAIAAATGRPFFEGNANPTGKNARPGRSTRTTPDSMAKRVAAALCLGAAVVLAGASVRALDASRSGRLAIDARVGIPQAIEVGLHATQADPGRNEYWHYLGLAYVAASRWADASVAFEHASRLAPYEVRHIGDLARAQLVLAGSGDAKARANALSLAEKAVQIDPNRPQAQLTRAVVMQVTGNLPEANRSADRALALDPQSRDDKLYVTAAQIKIDLGRPADAVTVARKGIAIFGASVRSVELRYELARALVLTSQPLDALKELDVALAIQPTERARTLRAQIAAALPK
jgi:O-antigen ligase